MFWIHLELCESVELGLRSELQESQSYIERDSGSKNQTTTNWVSLTWEDNARSAERWSSAHLFVLCDPHAPATPRVNNPDHTLFQKLFLRLSFRSWCLIRVFKNLMLFPCFSVTFLHMFRIYVKKLIKKKANFRSHLSSNCLSKDSAVWCTEIVF